MAVDVVAKGIEFWKAVKKWDADKVKKSDLPDEEASNAEALDEKLQEEINSPDGANNLNKLNEQVDNNHSLRDTFMEGVNNEEQPNHSADILDHVVDDMSQGEKIQVEASDQEPPEDMPPAGREPWKKFTTGEKLLKCANIAVGIAFTIAMSLDLKDNWDNITDAGKALNVLQIVIQGLTVLVDAAVLVGDAMVSAASIAADCTMMVALPVIGAVLAAIGIVVMVVLMFLDTYKPKEPPLSPAETFFKDVGQPLVNGFADPPAISLTYTAPAAVTSGTPQSRITITATNNTNQDVTLTRSTLTLEVGADDAALFSDPTAPWAVVDSFDPSNASTLSTAGTVGAGPATIVTGKLTPQARGEGLSEYDLALLGPQTAGTSGPLVVKKGESLQVVWLGTVNKAGSTVLQIIETLVNGDKCRFLANVVRS